MPDMRNAFPSRYLRAADLPSGRDVVVNISHVEWETLRDGEKPKPVLYFRNKEKGLVLNTTNNETCMDMYGPQSEDWVDKPVTLFTTRVKFEGRNVDAIRIKFIQPQSKQSKRQKAQAAEPDTGEDMNDEVPF